MNQKTNGSQINFWSNAHYWNHINELILVISSVIKLYYDDSISMYDNYFWIHHNLNSADIINFSTYLSSISSSDSGSDSSGYSEDEDSRDRKLRRKKRKYNRERDRDRDRRKKHKKRHKHDKKKSSRKSKMIVMMMPID